jgi:pyruvate dehydrogenase (quinone)
MRYPYELNVVADSKAALTALLPLLDRKTDRGWRAKVEGNVTRWWQTMQRQALLESNRPGMVNPTRLVWELNDQIPDNTMVTADSGSSANWYARHLRLRDHMRGSLSGNLATMGPGVPYAIGAKFAHPDRPAVALVGDGAMQINGMAELITVSHYYRQWADPRLIVAVLHNNDLNQVTWEMRAMEGAPKFVESQSLPSVSYAGFAASLGLQAIEVHEPGDLKEAWHKGSPPTGPLSWMSIATRTSPPIPPHANFEQVKDLAKAMLAGDEDALGVIRTGIKVKAQEFVPSSRTKR